MSQQFVLLAVAEDETVVTHKRPFHPTAVHKHRQTEEGEEAERQRALPSRGVRLEPFFPSRPCWEYCLSRFWALRIVPAPINTRREKERGGQMQGFQKQRKRPWRRDRGETSKTPITRQQNHCRIHPEKPTTRLPHAHTQNTVHIKHHKHQKNTSS